MNADAKGWVYVFLQVVMIAGVIFLSMYDFLRIIPYSYAYKIAGLVMVVTGFLIMAIQILTFFRFGQIMTPNPVPPSQYKLVQTGFYKFIRHPTYFAALFILLGVAVYYHSVTGFIAWLFGVMFILWKITFEEKSLKEKFPEYDEYQKKTKKIIPFIY